MALAAELASVLEEHFRVVKLNVFTEADTVMLLA
jgi:hypothetical protein